MKRNKFMTAMAALLGASALTANASVQMLKDFEDLQLDFGKGGYGCTTTLEDNPYKTGNTSAKVAKIEIGGWGYDCISNTADLTKKIIAVDAFAFSDVTMKCMIGDKGDLYPQVKANVWTTMYYDLRHLADGTETTIGFGGGDNGVGTVYVDNIRLVDAVGEDALAESEPKPMEADVEYTWGRLPIGGGGFVSGLLSVPGKVKLARTDVGGAYIWKDNQWNQMFDFVSEANVGELCVEAMAVDPSDVNKMYFLTGCQYFSGQKTAVMYTKDGGKTFKESDLTSMPFFVHGNGDGRNAGERIAVDPNNGDIIYAGSRLGTPLAVSANGGKTFAAVASFPSNVYTTSVKWPSWDNKEYKTTENQNGTSCVLIDPSKKTADGSKSARIFVGISRTGADNLYVTEDGGETWTAVQTPDNSLMPVRMKFDADGKVLMTMNDKHWSAAKGSIYRMDPETKQFTDISPASHLAFGDVQCKPSDANYLVASTNNSWVPQKWDNGKVVNSRGDIFYVSQDGGKNWVSLQDNMVIKKNDVTWIPGYAIHWCGSICFDPEDENKASFTSGNGIFTCDNIWSMLDGTKAEFYFDVKGLEETVSLDLISIPGGDVYSVIGDYTGFRHKNVTDYAPILVPSPGTTQGIGYAALNTGYICRVGANNEWGGKYDSYLTTDGGDNWENIGNVDANKVTFTADASAMIIAKSGGNVEYSTDNGKTWSQASGATGVQYVVGDPVDTKTVYACGGGKVFVSQDGGKSFTACTVDMDDSFSRLCVVPGREGLVYVPCGGKGLAVSKDKGKTFSKVESIMSCSCIGSGKGKDSTSYTLFAWGKATTAVGLLWSTDEGESWKIINDAKHQFGGPGNGKYVIGDQNVYGRVYMATVGQGIVYGDRVIPEEAETIEADAVARGAAVVAYPNPTTTSFTLNDGGFVEIYNASGKLVASGNYEAGANIGETLPKGIYTVCVNNKTVKVVKK